MAFPPASVCPAEAIRSLSLSFLTCQMDITFVWLRGATAGLLRKAWSSVVSFSWDVGSPATAEGRGDCPPFSQVYSLPRDQPGDKERPPRVGIAVVTERGSESELHSDSLFLLRIRFL